MTSWTAIKKAVAETLTQIIIIIIIIIILEDFYIYNYFININTGFYFLLFYLINQFTMNSLSGQTTV